MVSVIVLSMRDIYNSLLKDIDKFDFYVILFVLRVYNFIRQEFLQLRWLSLRRVQSLQTNHDIDMYSFVCK